MLTRISIVLFVCLALVLTACGGSAEPTPPPASPTPSGDPVAGATLFQQSCASCHGSDAKGVAGLGKDMTTSTFIAGLTDQELLAFVKTGRPTSDPANTTGVDMPPKGGNPALNDQQIMDIIAHMRSVHQ